MKTPKPRYKKSEVCDNCGIDWDRQGNVRRVVLCDLHVATSDLLAALKELTTRAKYLGVDGVAWVGARVALARAERRRP